MLHYRIVPVTPYQQNCSVVWCDQTQEAAVVDPGGDLHLIQSVLEQNQLTLKQILLTHGHLDHAGGTAALAKQHSVPIIGPHKDDDFWIEQLPTQCQTMGFPPTESFVPNTWLQQGDEITIGQSVLQVFHCPGHTPGHVVFFDPEAKVALVGDVLFQGSIGRTDFPRGNHDDLIASIRNKLWPLGDDVQFVPGHGPMSTFGQERATNPFVADSRYR